MNLLKNFTSYIKKEDLFQPKDKLLLAVSGGVDSVVLCELCKQAGYDLLIVHCNFQLRGGESERDEKFVRDLGKIYGGEVLVKRFDTEKYAAENKLSTQVAARELRYAWFHELIDASAARYIVTAHHANDNVETMLMNFFKGTGINGLKAILPKQGKIARPLLFAKKEELAAFATGNKLAYVEDSSNASDKYTRNYFRNQLIPGLQKIFPQVEDNLMDNLQRFHEIELLYQQAINQHKRKLLEQKGNEIHIAVLKLLKSTPLTTIIYEIIKDHGFTAHQTGEVIALMNSGSGKYIQSSSHRIIKNRDWLIISPNETLLAQHILIQEGEDNVQYAMGNLQFKKLPVASYQLPIADSIAMLDAGKIKFPLLLRKWKQGDYFYPLGMQKKKKLSRFFIDQKLSLTRKERIWVLEMEKKIIWVVGLRIDDRFKITDSTKNFLQISLIMPK